jgi:hypothetical protein
VYNQSPLATLQNKRDQKDNKKLMTLKQTLNFILGLQGSTFILIAGLALSFVLLALFCIWIVALLYSGLSLDQYLRILLG